MNNMMNMFMSMMNGGKSNPMMNMMNQIQGGQMNPQQLMQIMNGNPMFAQAQKMIQGGGNPQDIIKNVAQQKGISMEQLQQMANQFGIKL